MTGMADTPLEILVEAVLFFKGGPVSIGELSKSIGKPKEAIEAAATILAASLEKRGMRLVRERDMFALATAPEAHELIEKMRKDELEGPLGKAGLETLSVIIFRAPIAKSDIDYIRGVNCSSILRSLLIRGLVERVENPDDKRSFLYRPTADLPAYFGFSSLADLPGYADTRAEVERVFAARAAAELGENKLEEETEKP